MSLTRNDGGHPDEAFTALAETMFDACGVCCAVRNGQGQIYDFRIEYVNRQASIDARVPVDQLVGKSLLDVLPLFRADELTEALRRVVETGEPLTLKRTTMLDAPEAAGAPTRPRRVLDIRLTRAGDSVVAVWRDVTAIAVAEQEHKNKQRMLRLVTDTIDDVFWAATPGIDASLYISPAYEQIWGRSRSELKTNPRAFVEGVHPDDRPRVLAHLHQLHQERRSSSVEYRVVRPNGDVRWVHERGFWADVEPGEEPAIVGVCTDVTDRVLAEQARLRSEWLLRKAESLAHIGAWEWDIVQDEVTLSDEWGKIHGRTEHRLGRSALLTHVHPDDRSRLEQQYRAVLEGKLTHLEVEYRIVRHNDGQERTLISRARRAEDSPGGSPRMVGCDQDITELKQVEQDLRASKKHLQSVYDVVGQAILSVRFPDRIIDGVNRRVEELLGYSPQELIGQSTGVLYPNPEAHERFGAQLQHALSEHRDRVRQELTVQRKDGKLVPCQITSTFLLERGVPYRVVSVLEDISERQKAEAETAALLAAAHAVLESRDFKQAASGILDVGKWNIGARTGCIAICEGECCGKAVIWGPPGTEGPRVVTPTGLFHEICRQNHVQQVNPVAESGFEDPILAGLGSPKNVLIAPISFEGKVRGVVVLADKDGDFDEIDARQIRALGEVTALSLQRERYVEQLLATERLLTTTGRMARVGGWELDCGTRRVSWTAVTRELHEVPEDYEPALDTALAFYCPDDRRCLESAVSVAMTQGRPFDLELRLTTAKGRDLWIHTKCTPVTEDGAVRTLFGAIQDITARKAAEAAVLARERFLALITENMFDMVSLVSIDGLFTYVSPSHKQLGHDPVSMTGHLVFDFVHPDDLAYVQAEVATTMKTFERRKVEYRYRRADGSYVWIESIGQVLSRAGKPTDMIVSSRDVSDLKRYQASLHAEKETAQRYLDVAAVMLLGVDVEGRVNLINRRGCEILGVPHPAALLGTDASLLVPAEERQAALAVRNALLQGNEAGAGRFESWVVTAQGEKRRIAWSNAVLRDEQNHAIGMLSSGEDITDRRTMEAQLAKADRLSSMGLLAAGVAHELNNPLSYVLSNLEGLTEELPGVLDTIATFFALAEGVEHPADLEALVRDAEQRMSSVVLSDILDRFKDALTGAQRMRDITRGLSSFARVDEDQLVPVSVAHVIDLALNMAHHEFKYRARVVKEYGRVPPVLAHEGRLCQVFVNLLTNAAHSIDEGNVEKNEIRVTTWTEANQICISVCDTGSGISDENLGRLFEPFFTTKKIGQGSGLGLPISKSIVESYGGTLQVTSKVGKGTQVTVRLPRRASNQVLDRSTEAPPSRPPIRGRILIVDDEEGMRAAITRVLRGHEVVWAASGAEAMTILERDSAFDLVLCDVMMSEVTGMDLHLWLIENHPRLGEQLIFMTGGAFTPRTRAYLSKVDNIRLEKPLDSANLRRLIADRVRQNHRS